MRTMLVQIFIIAALSTIQLATGQSNTVLYIYPLGSSNTGSTQGVTIGTTIVFSCTIPGLGAYAGAFGYTELHAIVGVVDTLICSATSTGTCAQGSQGAPYASRSISATVPTTVGTSFTMTAAVVADSIGYYCKIIAGNVLYSQATGVTTPLQVYAVANQPTLSFASGTSVFLSGQALPQITCSANVGAPYGWLQLTASGFIGTSSTAPYPSYLTLASNSTVLQSNGTYTMTYTFSYSTGTYTLSNSNNNDYFVCYAYNSYVYQSVTQSGVASSALTVQVQYPVTGITVSLPVGSSLSQYFVQSGTSYTLTVTQGTVVTLYCTAQGSPSPTFQWTRLSGQNGVTLFSSQVSSTVSIVEILTLQCNASNTISASSPSYGTSQTATVNVNVVGTSTTSTTTTAAVAAAGLSGGGIAGIVIAIVVVIALVIILSIWCTRCPPKSMRKGETTKAQPSLQPMQSSTLQSVPPSSFDQEKKQPLSMTSEMDIPYDGGSFDDSPRSRKPIVDPHAQSAAEYLDLRGSGYVNGDAGANGAPLASQPTTPTANMTAPPTYPGGGSANATMARGNGYGTQPAANAGYGSQPAPNAGYGSQAAPNAYGTMNAYGANGGYGTMMT